MSASKTSTSTSDTNMPPPPAYAYDTPIASIGESKPTLHHADSSQSHYILWLLEELNIPYNLQLYSRDPISKELPRTLRVIHPMGKSPVVTVPATASTPALTITESAAIISYLLRTYDKADRFNGLEQTPEGLVTSESLTSFALTSIGNSIFIQMFSERWKALHPTALPMRQVADGMRAFSDPQLKLCLACIQKELGDKNYFGGEELGTVDFMMSWPLDLVLQRKWCDLNREFPKLAAWVSRYQGRKAYKSALEKGNGYDLTAI